MNNEQHRQIRIGVRLPFASSIYYKFHNQFLCLRPPTGERDLYIAWPGPSVQAYAGRSLDVATNDSRYARRRPNLA